MVARKNGNLTFAAACYMLSHRECDYISIFQYLNSYFGQMKFSVLKSDMEAAIINSVNKTMEFEKHGICRFHQVNIIRGYFRSAALISSLMFRKDRKQELLNIFSKPACPFQLRERIFINQKDFIMDPFLYKYKVKQYLNIYIIL